ncbi:hypothetical protein L8Y18_06835 [Campylobacter sp. CNRCH_2007_0968H]|uniref:hypothetical protein n=1 Tax=Campylobacter sp. CNRCH_2007_0968H TaxID=2911598 RepID=UPI0021E6CD85|nr:hypothetical protein [Campylobacter sp. CNRCH_2007_0968H]MCV3531149.1 hypothetical protein [Campylobacter sp. CNRCH_2007_0968H]
MKWNITAKDLENFCNTNPRRAQELLPNLTYKLIKASVELEQIYLPKGSSISNPGYDGFIKTKDRHRIIPIGKSIWEFGTDQKISSKAEKDYKKRLHNSDPNITFIFGTFRAWTKKDIFCKKYTDKHKWKEVKALNSVDYEAWLEDHPSIALHLAQEIGKLPPQNIKLISARLEDWRKQTQVELKDELVLCNRENEQFAFINSLKNKNGLINIIAPIESEGLIFSLSIIEKNTDYTDRTLIIQSQDVWDNIVEVYNGLILFYEGFEPNNIGYATSKHLVVRISRNNKEITKEHNDIYLTKQDKTRVLEKMGFSTLEANKINKDTFGNLDFIAIHPKLKPIDNNILIKLEKIIKNDLHSYLPLFLAGSWDTSYTGDVNFLEAISEKKYIDLKKHIENIKITNLLEIAGLHYHKILLKKLIINYFYNYTIDDLFLENIKNVFLEKDKTFKEKQASISNFTFTHSRFLRKELADTLVILAVDNPNNQHKIDKTIEDIIDKNNIVESIFNLKDVLGLLAEASPRGIINQFKLLVKNKKERELLKRFFEKDTFLFDDSQCLFYTLKIIAWDHNYFTEVVKVLFELGKNDFCKKECLITLQTLFTGWIHNTNTPHNKRIALLENFYTNNSEVIWNILCGILPSNYEVQIGHSYPKHRNWHNGFEFNSKNISNEYSEYIEAATQLILKNTNNLEKSFYCISILTKINTKYQSDFVDKLETFLKNANNKKKFEIKQKITEQIENIKNYNWPVSRECITKMQKLVESICFNNPLYENLHLFQYHGKENSEHLHTQRLQAIKNICQQAGVRYIFILIRESSSIVCGKIGEIIYEINYLKFESTMFKWLVSNTKNKQLCARGFFLRNIDKILQDNIKLKSITAQQRIELFKISKPDNTKLKILKEQNLDEQKHYWENFTIYVEQDSDLISSIFYTLLSFNMPEKALLFLGVSLSMWISFDKIKINIEDITNAMLQVDPKKCNGDEERYYYGEIIKKLQEVDLNLFIMFNIEWKFLQLRNFNCIFSLRYMLQNPHSFIDLIFPNNNDMQKLDSKSKKAYEENLFYFLKFFSFLNPITNQPILNTDEMKKWIEEVINYATKTQPDDKILYLKYIIGDLLWQFINSHEATSLSSKILKIIDEYLEDSQIKDGFIQEGLGLPKITCEKVDEIGEKEKQEAEKYNKYAIFFRDKFFINLFECFLKKSNQCTRKAIFEDEYKKIIQLA